ncbi:MAG: EamA family transporter [Clostridia bacterium]|nr:EamA family transporter [Clostridia bacterium]
MPQSPSFSVTLLLIAILSCGIYSVGLKPSNQRCRSLAEQELFNGLFSATAMVGAILSALLSSGSLYIPLGGVLTAALFGFGFSMCVFTNLKALEEGPLSLTTLIVNFSLIFPMFYSFFFLGEAVTVVRICGILLLLVCMLLFTNPRITGEKKISARWIVISAISMLINGLLAVIAKIYTLKTDGAYAAQFLVYGYLFATLTSFVLSAILRAGQRKEERRPLRAFFTPAIVFLFLLVGAANFGMNLMVLLLATLMDGAIVYPAIQGGGPMIAVLGSRFLFGEQISWKKWIAIILGVLAIVMLNL